jgi:hypothetical protein
MAPVKSDVKTNSTFDLFILLGWNVGAPTDMLTVPNG